MTSAITHKASNESTNKSVHFVLDIVKHIRIDTDVSAFYMCSIYSFTVVNLEGIFPYKRVIHNALTISEGNGLSLDVLCVIKKST